ncbi:MAG TPA: VCBS repeat-containing protein, partial [Candidatus Acidoferrum sp.]|nr:VCBS repeat-containing protein [Candidatus Acidoferrum sp.]
MTRRDLFSLLGAQAASLYAQGMASRNAKAAPRGKFSGLPFHAKFTDIARQAGLTEVSVAGHADHNDYIVEGLSGGAAFFDYDHDGWLDVLVLCGSRFGDPPAGASNRLYRNNRDGTFTDVTEKAGLFRTGYAFGVTVGDFNNDGFDDLFITYWGQNVLYRNNGDGTFTDVTKAAGLIDATPRFGTGCAFVDY